MAAQRYGCGWVGICVYCIGPPARDCAGPCGDRVRWSLEFVADQFIDGRRVRILVVVDDRTRECLALVADTSISGIRVARELDRLAHKRAVLDAWRTNTARPHSRLLAEAQPLDAAQRVRVGGRCLTGYRMEDNAECMVLLGSGLYWA
jgi:transposase InsO family protein